MVVVLLLGVTRRSSWQFQYWARSSLKALVLRKTHTVEATLLCTRSFSAQRAA